MISKEEFLKKAEAKWESLQKTRSKTTSFYDYEKAFDELWVEFGRDTLEGSINKVGKDRRKKKNSRPVMDK